MTGRPVSTGDRRALPRDPWGNAYQYESPSYSGTGDLLLYSLGSDGMPGGEGEDADVHWD